MGEIVKIDGRGRITLPAQIRELVSSKVFKVEVSGKDTVILRALNDKRVLVEKVASITFSGDVERASVDVQNVKDFYGGVKL